MRTSWILGATLLASFCTLAHGACPAPVAAQLQLGGTTICVLIDDAALTKQRALLRTWIDRSARIVADYYGQFPVPMVVIRLGGMDGRSIGGGRTTNDSGLMIQMRVGR